MKQLLITKCFIKYVGPKIEGMIVNDLSEPGEPDYKNLFPINEEVEVAENVFKLAQRKAGKNSPNWIFTVRKVVSAEDRIDNLENMVSDPGERDPNELFPPPVAKIKPKTTKKRGRPKQAEA